MNKLFILFIAIILCYNANAQVKVIDKVIKNISLQHANTDVELRADEIEDGKIKITFIASTNKNGIHDLGEIYLNSYSEFEELYQIISWGFDNKKNQTTFVELPNSKLTLSYFKMLYGTPYLGITHSYNNSLYQTRSTQRLSKKEINKLFAKDESFQ